MRMLMVPFYLTGTILKFNYLNTDPLSFELSICSVFFFISLSLSLYLLACDPSSSGKSSHYILEREMGMVLLGDFLKMKLAKLDTPLCISEKEDHILTVGKTCSLSLSLSLAMSLVLILKFPYWNKCRPQRLQLQQLKTLKKCCSCCYSIDGNFESRVI